MNPVIGMNEADRMLRAKLIGRMADILFRQHCADLNLDEAAAFAASPLLALAYRRAAMPIVGQV